MREARDSDNVRSSTLARADSGRAGSRWMFTNIVWNADLLRSIELEEAVEIALAHELGHAFGLWHTDGDAGFVMKATFWPSNPGGWPQRESQLAQLAYDVAAAVILAVLLALAGARRSC